MACEQYLEANMFSGSASDLDGMTIQREIIADHIRLMKIKTVCGYISSGVFGCLAFALIMYGPVDKATAGNLFAGAFLVLSAGIAGFTQVHAQGAGFNVEAATRQLNADAKPEKKVQRSKGQKKPVTAPVPQYDATASTH